MRRVVAVASLVLAGVPTVGTASCTSGRLQSAQATYTVGVPLGLDLVAPVPRDNAPTSAKVDLGRRLFFDPAMSADRTLSCASCHQPARYFTDGRALPVGIRGRIGTRNVPSVVNSAYGRSFFWDGRAGSLEEQVLQPIAGEGELGLSLPELVRRLRDEESYRKAFREAFGTEDVSAELVAQALASYLRSLRSGDAAVDRFLNGDDDALTLEARLGFRLFVGRANCGVCHMAPLFTDHRFHNTGVSWGSSDRGRFEISGDAKDRGAFKTPSLRNVAMTAPYMHDGSLATLEDVIEHYDRGGTSNPHLDEEIAPLGLSDAEKGQLIAFLNSLTGSSP